MIWIKLRIIFKLLSILSLILLMVGYFIAVKYHCRIGRIAVIGGHVPGAAWIEVVKLDAAQLQRGDVNRVDYEVLSLSGLLDRIEESQRMPVDCGVVPWWLFTMNVASWYYVLLSMMLWIVISYRVKTWKLDGSMK